MYVKFSSTLNSYKCTRIHDLFITIATECVPLFSWVFKHAKLQQACLFAT